MIHASHRGACTMDRSERFHRIIRMLKQRRVVSRDSFLETLEISRATFKRDLEYLRDRMDAPILWDPEAGGYRLATESGEPQNYELPGLWLNAGELYALLAMDQLLDGMQPGLLGPHVRPLRDRIRRLIEVGAHSAEEVGRRIRVLEVGNRVMEPECFQALASAVLSRRRLRIRHYNRVRDEATSAPCRRSAWSITGTTGTWTPGATSGRRYALSRPMQWWRPACWNAARGKSAKPGWTATWVPASGFSPARAPSWRCCSSARTGRDGCRVKPGTPSRKASSSWTVPTCSRCLTAIPASW